MKNARFLNNLLKRGAAVVMLASLMPSMAACQRKDAFTSPMNQNEIPYAFAETDTYRNGQDIEGQWGSGLYTGPGEYGIGDPFVLRYDGRYYMYPSSDWSSGEGPGVKVFSSDDLVNWTYEGFAATGPETDSAYAPEVVYYNGYFYMTESQAGNGHYIFRSESPTGPFVKVTRNFGRCIDGSFWIADDGQLYFLYPTDNVIQIAPVNAAIMIPGAEKPLVGTLNGWTEGPGLFRRGDFLYLTYAGNNVITDGYRVGYSYQMGSDPTGQFIMPENNLLLLSTGPGNFKGLGHNSNVIGPDLDSWYTAYHNLLSLDGPQRRYMLDRVVTNGAVILANGPTYTDVAVPARPDFETRGTQVLTAAGSFLLSGDATEAVFTAEFNFTPGEGGTTSFVFAWTDERNYSRVTWDDSSGTLTLTRIRDGKEEQLGTAQADGLNAGVLHTLRLEQGGDRLCVTLDNMRKLDLTHSGTAGRIGVGGQAEFSYIAFSNDAFGTSDFEAVKIVSGSFPAVHYLKGENRGFSIRKARITENGVRQGEKEHTNLNECTGVYALVLDSTNDWVKYAIQVTEESFYGLSGRITPDSAGARFQVIVDEKDIYTFTVPETGLEEGEFGNVMLGRLPLAEGNHTLKLRLVEGKLEATQFTLEPTAPAPISTDNATTGIDEKSWSYVGEWMLVDDAHAVRAGDMAFAYAGDERMTDFTIELETAMTEDAADYDARIMLRIKNHSLSAGDEAFQGYYLSIGNDRITLNRCNYGGKELDLIEVDFRKDVYHRIRVEMRNNRIRVYVDDMDAPAIDYCDADAFLAGQLILCSNKAGVSFKNVKVQTAS